MNNTCYINNVYIDITWIKNDYYKFSVNERTYIRLRCRLTTKKSINKCILDDQQMNLCDKFIKKVISHYGFNQYDGEQFISECIKNDFYDFKFYEKNTKRSNIYCPKCNSLKYKLELNNESKTRNYMCISCGFKWNYIYSSIDVVRQTDKKDYYCIYRKINNNKYICSVKENLCMFSNDGTQKKCSIKVDAYFINSNNNTNLKNIKRLPEDLLYITKIDKHAKPHQLPVYINSDEISKNKNKHNNEQYWYEDPTINWKIDNWSRLKEVKTVYVFNSFLMCSTLKHSLDYIKVDIISLHNKSRVYEAYMIYCNDCKKYFIDNVQYRKILKAGIFPNFRVKPYGGYSAGSDFSNLRTESELSLYGYNARKNTPVEYREMVLYNIITNKLMSASEVISFLQGLISLFQMRRDTYDVIKRYEHDIEYIHRTFHDREDFYYYYNLD